MSRLLILTDVHHGEDGQSVQGSAAWPLFERVLAVAAEQRPDLLIDLGDRVNGPEVTRAEAIMREVAAGFRQFTRPRVHLQGNDDAVPRVEQEALLSGPLGNRALELGGWHLVFLDTFDGSVEGAIMEETLAWLEQTLVASTLPAVLFSHQPLDGEPLPGNIFFGGEYAYQAHPKGHEALRRVLAQSKRVKLAVAGHAHEQRAVTVGGVLYVTLDALVPFVGETRTELTYGLLELAPDSARLQTYGRAPQNFEVTG